MSENIVNDEPRPTGLEKSYPLELNSVQYHYFKTWNTTLNDTVATHNTESGKQEDVVTRKGRRSIGVTVTCLQPLLASLLGLQQLDEFEAKIYDPAIDDYATIDVRIGQGSMSYNLVEKSAYLSEVNGVYEVSFTLEEF